MSQHVTDAYNVARSHSDVRTRLRARAVILANTAGMGEVARQMEMAEALADLCLIIAEVRT